MSEQATTKEAFGRDYFIIDPEQCALVVIDMQNSFVEEGAVFEAPRGREIIPAINQLIEHARSTGIPVIWTQSDHSPPGGGLILERYPVIKNTHELWIGDRSHDLYEEVIPPIESEHRVVKHKYDAFYDTDLDTALKNLGKDTIILVGVASEVCCESTARTGFFKEYKMVMPRDATAAFRPELHDVTCDRIDALFGRVMSTSELLTILESGE